MKPTLEKSISWLRTFACAIENIEVAGKFNNYLETIIENTIQFKKNKKPITVAALISDLVEDREKMKAALLHYHEMYSGCFVTHHGNGEQSLCEVNQYDIGDVARKALGINS